MGNYLDWVQSSEAELLHAYKRVGVNGIFITPYCSSTKFWQGKTGWIFSRVPLYLAVEIGGKEKESGFHYVELGFTFSVRNNNVKTHQNKRFIFDSFDECLKRVGIDKLVFFESLEKLDVPEKGKEALNGLVALLKPFDPDEIKKIQQEESARHKRKLEEEKKNTSTKNITE